jgi:Rrf2 family protein
MDFNKTTQYALRILSFMAEDETKMYSTNEIFESLKIPYRYLRKQMTILSKTGLIISIQGKYGGFKLNRNIKDISLFEIVKATEETRFDNICFFGHDKCSLKKKCAVHYKWLQVREHIINVLKTTSLLDIKNSGPHQFMSNSQLLIT